MYSAGADGASTTGSGSRSGGDGGGGGYGGISLKSVVKIYSGGQAKPTYVLLALLTSELNESISG